MSAATSVRSPLLWALLEFVEASYSDTAVFAYLQNKGVPSVLNIQRQSSCDGKGLASFDPRVHFGDSAFIKLHSNN